MEYGIKLKDILDKCNLNDSQRRAFEDFFDGKVTKYREDYPDFEKKLKNAEENNPLLAEARKKIYQARQWGNIIALFYSIN